MAVGTLTNLGIGAAKMVVGSIGGSSAMLAEGIHSLVDTADQLVMLGALHRDRGNSDGHTFLDGRKAHYWSLVISMVVYGAGAGASFLIGLARLARSGGEGVGTGWSYGVLGASAAFQGASWIVGASKVAQSRSGGSPSRIFRARVEPGLMAVVAQDTAALLGLLFALLGILGDRVLGLRILDPIASMSIGVLMAGVALILARERFTLLLGETAGAESIQRMRSAIQREPSVASVGEVWGMHLGPDELLVSCEVEFRRDPLGANGEEAIDRIEKAARAAEPRASRVFIAVQSERYRESAGSSDRPRGTSASLSGR